MSFPRWTPSHGHTIVGGPAKTYCRQLCKKTYQVQWPIGTDDEKESKKSVLTAHLDDDDDVERDKSTLAMAGISHFMNRLIKTIQRLTSIYYRVFLSISIIIYNNPLCFLNKNTVCFVLLYFALFSLFIFGWFFFFFFFFFFSSFFFAFEVHFFSALWVLTIHDQSVLRVIVNRLAILAGCFVLRRINHFRVI